MVIQSIIVCTGDIVISRTLCLCLPVFNKTYPCTEHLKTSTNLIGSNTVLQTAMNFHPPDLVPPFNLVPLVHTNHGEPNILHCSLHPQQQNKCVITLESNANQQIIQCRGNSLQYLEDKLNWDEDSFYSDSNHYGDTETEIKQKAMVVRAQASLSLQIWKKMKQIVTKIQITRHL